MSKQYQVLIEGYHALGLEVGASTRSIKTAYRKLMKEWHPDVNRNSAWSEEKTKELNTAFRQLKSASAAELRGLRVFYRSSSQPAARAPVKPKRRQPPPPTSPVRDRWPWATRTGGAEQHRRRGRNVIGRVSLSPLEEAVGARWQLSIPTCRACGGWGAAINATLTVCEACHGLGACDLPWPTFTCTHCNGRGSHYDLACATCGGNGNSTRYHAKFSVPPGIGRSFFGLVDGLGHPGISGGNPGDLFLLVS